MKKTDKKENILLDDESNLLKIKGIISKMIDADRKFSRSDSSVGIRSRWKDELRELERAFGQMIEQKQKSDEQILLLSNTLKSANDIIAIADVNFNFLFANDAFCKTFGYTQEELTGKFVGSVLLERDDGKVGEITDPKIFMDGWKGEQWSKTKDGKEILVEMRISPVKNSIGEVIAAVAVANEITEKKRLAKELLESKQRLEMLMKSSSTMIYSSEAFGDFDAKYISGNFSSITGYADEVFFKKGWWAKNIHPDDAQEVFKNLGELFQKGNHSHEYRFLFNDGSWHWMHDDLKLIKDDSGNPIELIGTWQDVTDRKLAELKLKESEAKLTDAMKIAKLSTWEYDFVLDRFTFPDQSFALFNTTAEQEGGNTMSSEHFAQKYIYPDDRVLIEKGLRKALETPDPAYTSQLEYRVIYAPGEIGYFAANVRIEKDADNRTIKALGVNQDITERKRVEDEIRKNEYRYRDLFENSGTPIWEVDLSEVINYITGLKDKGIGDLRTYFDEHIDEVIRCVSMVKLIDANKEILNFFKATQKEDVLTGLFDFFIEESFDTAKDVLVALARTEENQKIGGEIPVKTLTGETKQAIFRISVVPEDENTLAKSLISFIDITERKQAEKALRERENSYRTLAENIPASVYRLYLRERGKMEFFNNVIEQMSGYTKDELRNGEICSIDPFIFPEDKQYVMEIVKNALRDNSEFEVEYRFIRKDGSLSYFHEKGRPVVGNDGKPLYIEGVIFDDTERNRTEKEIKEKNEQLKKLNAEKDKFFSIIAHDLKSPFYGFLNLTELMSDSSEVFSREELVEYSKLLNEGARNLYKLLENLLEWSQVQKGAIDFAPKDSDLSKMVSQSIETIYQMAKQKRISIINEIVDTQKVYADEKMIGTVLRNLLSNAVKFTRKDGNTIIKSKWLDNDTIEVAVEDNGVGIPEKDIHRLFKIEEKVSSQGTEGESSTGLGLLLCKEFIEMHGGKIWVESEYGKGSKFKFTLHKSIETS